MTQEDAIREFYEAVQTAIESSPEIRNAVGDLNAAGVKLDSMTIAAALSLVSSPLGQHEPADKREVVARHDTEFLRKLRISPDLEVRE